MRNIVDTTALVVAGFLAYKLNNIGILGWTLVAVVVL